MPKAGSLRFTEERYRELAARTSSWTTGTATTAANVDTEGAHLYERPKYNNVKTNGYASKREAKRAAELKALEAAGQIRNLKEQVPYLLIPKYIDANGKVLERACHYIADFTYEEAPTWNPVTEDCKGMKTDVYRLKRKLLLFVAGIKIKET